jgi:IS30 family transposase
MDELITPLVRQGQSFEAIWQTHEKELPIGVRSAYNYQEAGILSTADIELPRKVRMKPRKKKEETKRERVDRSGRTYADFQALALSDQARVVQGDSVQGYQENKQDVLSLHFVARAFQMYLLKKHGKAAAVVACLDAIERLLGVREAFEAALGIMLVDRGVEFDDWEGMERSCLEPGLRRCRVFYCDPMATNQKSQAERNHEQLRRILPKGRSDFDALSVWDVAVCCSHVNSYPSAGRGGKCPFELLGELLPQELLDNLGIVRVAPDEVVLRPSLIAHAVVQ